MVSKPEIAEPILNSETCENCICYALANNWWPCNCESTNHGFFGSPEVHAVTANSDSDLFVHTCELSFFLHFEVLANAYMYLIDERLLCRLEVGFEDNFEIVS